MFSSTSSFQKRSTRIPRDRKKVSRTASVRLSACCHPSIHLDDQPALEADEVEDEVRERHLPAELRTFQPPAAQRLPQHVLRPRRIPPHAAGTVPVNRRRLVAHRVAPAPEPSMIPSPEKSCTYPFGLSCRFFVLSHKGRGDGAAPSKLPLSRLSPSSSSGLTRGSKTKHFRCRDGPFQLTCTGNNLIWLPVPGSSGQARG